MFGIGLPEMMVIAAVALIFIGPDKLPGVMRSVGRGLVQLKGYLQIPPGAFLGKLRWEWKNVARVCKKARKIQILKKFFY